MRSVRAAPHEVLNPPHPSLTVREGARGPAALWSPAKGKNVGEQEALLRALPYRGFAEVGSWNAFPPSGTSYFGRSRVTWKTVLLRTAAVGAPGRHMCSEPLAALRARSTAVLLRGGDCDCGGTWCCSVRNRRCPLRGCTYFWCKTRKLPGRFRRNFVLGGVVPSGCTYLWRKTREQQRRFERNCVLEDAIPCGDALTF
ncbi:hypothetical protein SAMN02744102_01110 [Paenibacillus barengoltzii]|nr:hypothetical protein SAMN02744102_01110 [Paenibacillus barengoltzii]